MSRLFTLFTTILSIGLGIGNAFAATPNPAPSQMPAGGVLDDTNTQLRNAVMDSLKLQGSIDANKKKIFDEEVVPQYALFIKDYHQVGNAVQAQVDVDGIRNYLGFFAAKDLVLGTPQLLLYMNVDARCPKCKDAAPNIKKMMQSRAQSHGFTPVWISPEDLLDSKPSELAEKRNAAGAMEISLKPAPMDDVDSAHEDEKKFIAHFSFDVRGIAHYEDQAELFDTDSFEQSATKMLTQSYVELGAKASLTGANALKQEMQILVSGFNDFSQYSQVKSAVIAKLKDIALVEERKISKGKAVFALKTNHSLDEIKQLVSALVAGVSLNVEMR
jgi:hypothetical protein